MSSNCGVIVCSSDIVFLQVQVWGMFFETLAFGIYLVTCCFCCRVLSMSRSQQKAFSVINWPLFVIFFIFLAKTTSSVVLHVALILRATPAGSQHEVVDDFQAGTNPINLSKYITIAIETVIGSGFFIYRCWLAYGRTRLVVVAPLVLWLAAVTVMGLLIHEDSIHKIEIQGIFGTPLSRVFGSWFWALIMAVNIITTVLIARRVWRIDYLTNHSYNTQTQPDRDDATSPTATKPNILILGQPHDTMKRATRIIIESGMIYTAVTIATFSLFITSDVHLHAVIEIVRLKSLEEAVLLPLTDCLAACANYWDCLQSRYHSQPPTN
ncbi:hypothetical protein GGX14DRAFT_450795 [Mycena pura]|uniref:Uncharacterized protein n=1 Tax=Mycena pura TaxID=153505 RepID=A0AAD6YBT0_9AGAR|nr:hypothetical protein GGX14DRAFT_450795 [Mycena pura]